MHLAVGHFAADIPVNSAGAAVPGRFGIADYPCAGSFEVEIPGHGVAGPAPFAIAAHAVVWNSCECYEETAWAAGETCCGCGITAEIMPFARGWAKWVSVTL